MELGNVVFLKVRFSKRDKSRVRFLSNGVFSSDKEMINWSRKEEVSYLLELE